MLVPLGQAGLNRDCWNGAIWNVKLLMSGSEANQTRGRARFDPSRPLQPLLGRGGGSPTRFDSCLGAVPRSVLLELR